MQKSVENFDIVTFGSLTIDTFIEPSELAIECEDQRECFSFEVGQKIKMRTIAKHVGGGAANTGIGFVHLGLNTAVVGNLGSGDNSQVIRHQLSGMGISTKYLQMHPGIPSSASIIIQIPDGRRTVLHERTTAKPFVSFPETNAIYCGHLAEAEEPLFERIVEWKKKNPRKIFGWNPGKTQFKKGLKHFSSICAVTDILILNVEEAALFSGKEWQLVPKDQYSNPIIGPKENLAPKVANVDEIAEAFLQSGIKHVIITDGKKGAQYFSADLEKPTSLLALSKAEERGVTSTYPSRGKRFLLPMVDVRPPVNTLGAGDSFSVGVVSALITGKSPEVMMVSGALNASSVVREFGAQNGLLDKATLEKKLRAFEF